MMKTAIACVLFDLDGTLIDTAPDFVVVMESLLREYGAAEISESRVRQTVSDGARALVKTGFSMEESDPGFGERRQRLLDLYGEQLQTTRSALYPGMDNLLARLETAEIPWGIVTNKPEQYAVPLLRKLRLLERCGALICPDHVSATKPDPESILLACDRLGADPERTVYIGDHLRDMQAAKNADVIAVAAAWGYLSADCRVEEWPADFILREARQTESLLNTLRFA